MIACNATSQGTEVRLSSEQAGVIWRDLERIPVLLEDLANTQQQVKTCEQLAGQYKAAAEAAKQEAGTQEQLAQLRENELAQSQKEARAKLVKSRIISISGWAVASLFVYLTLTN